MGMSTDRSCIAPAMLTRRQLQLFDLIAEEVTTGSARTLRQLACAMGVGSASTVHRMLWSMASRGAIQTRHGVIGIPSRLRFFRFNEITNELEPLSRG